MSNQDKTLLELLDKDLNTYHANKSAVSTLKALGYAYKGGERWVPPIGKPHKFALEAALKKLLYACDGLSCEYRDENYGNARQWLRHVEAAYSEYQGAEDGEPVEYTKEMSDNNELPPVGCKAFCAYNQEVRYIVAHDLTDYPHLALSVGDDGYSGSDGGHWLTVEEGEALCST